MTQTVIYVHGKGGTPAEADHYRPLFPEADVIGFPYRSGTPWDASEEFPRFFQPLRRKYDHVTLIANSIGAYFAMSAGIDPVVDEAFFISPIVDMERLMNDIMTWTGVTEEDLKREETIATPMGETLSWAYLRYVRSHPVTWNVPTHVLFGDRDRLTSLDTVSAFARKNHATLDVMPGGEHWFHTPEQMAFLDDWLRRSQKPV